MLRTYLNTKVKLIFNISFIFVVASSLWSQDFHQVGARPVGMAEAFTSIADDANALRWNPAGLAYLPINQFTFSYTKLFWGIEGDNLYQGFVGYAHPTRRLGTFGISLVARYTDTFQQSRMGLSYSYKLMGTSFRRGLSMGVTLDLYRDEIDRSELELVDPDDPLLTGPQALMAPIIHLGFLYKMNGLNIKHGFGLKLY